MSGRADTRAIRAAVAGAVQGVGFREATRRRALALGVQGWVRNAEDGTVVVHAEGPPPAIDELIAFLQNGPRAAAVAQVEVREVAVEGHEQFAVRGISAGSFLVREHAATTRHFDLRLQLAGAMRSWAGRPSMKRRTKAPSAHERFGVGSGGATQFVSTGTIGSVPSGMRKCAGTDTSSQNSRSWLTARSKPASSPVASRAFPQSDAPGTWRSGILRKPAAPRGAQCLSPTPTQYAGRLS